MPENDSIILAKVEQQLADSVKNQAQIIEDLRTIFDRIEKESKIISATRSDIKSHLESSIVRKEDLNNRFKYIEEKLSELKQTLKDISSDNKVKEVEKKFDSFKTEIGEFKTEILTSLRVTKWIFGSIITIGTFIVVVINIIKFVKGI